MVETPAGQQPNPALATMLKAMRRRRGLRSREVARDMGLPLRSYQHFEAGYGRLNRDVISRFAAAVDADAAAILTALDLGAPDFALACVDNKLMTILLGALQDFNGRAGGDTERLDPRNRLIN